MDGEIAPSNGVQSYS